MPLGVLNNISAVYAENNLNQTQASLQNVLTQLSSGSRINSGADDPAGLSISNGLAANAAALSQSSRNASEGAGFLQVADGALSQVTSLLTSAITLATEAGGGTLSASQMGAANQEYQDILTQIGTIGGTTEYNGITVFSGDQTTSQLTWGNTAAPWSSSTTASSATATAAAVGASGIVAGGTKANATAPTVANSPATGALVWSTGDSGTSLNTTIAAGSILTGHLTFTPTWSSGSPSPVDVNLSTLNTSTTTLLQSSLQAALNVSAPGDYTATVSNAGAVKIIIKGSPTDANLTAVNAPTVSGSDQLPTSFTLTVKDGSVLSGKLDVTPTTNGTTAASPTQINLNGVTTANLASTVSAALNANPLAPDYSVAYTANGASSTLVVTMLSQAGTDKITSIDAASDATTPLSQATPAAATVAFTNGDALSGEFTITPVINGSASQAVSVNLAGYTASQAGFTAAFDAALGTKATDYNVVYTPGSGATGTLSISANTANLDGLSSVSLASGDGNGGSLMTQGTVAETNIATANTAMGNFTLTPTGSSTTPITINLKGLSPAGVGSANLLAGVQAQLNAAAAGEYAVSYDSSSDATSGNLSISLTSAGVAAGLTGFTAAEASQAAASQETPITGGVDIYTSDGTTGGSQNYNVTVGVLSDASVGTSPFDSDMGDDITATVGNVVGTGGVAGGAGAGTSLIGTNLNTQANAEAALATADNAITGVAYMRGQVGANINTLTAASNIASSEQTNITAAQNTISATDYAAATSNMSKFEILTQTGISALAQANSTQQMVTKLLQ
jgi:flagellin